MNLDENPDAARRVAAANGMAWPVVQTGGWDNPIIARWKVSALPAIFVLDAKGIVRYIGPRGPALDRAVATLLAEHTAG